MSKFDTSPQIPGLVDAALQAARAGAEVIRAGSGSISEVRGKGEAGNLVTDIDVAAERATRASLAQTRPDDLVTGEELPDNRPENPRIRWSIDPLDGTTNFIRGIPYFCSAVGAMDIETGEWIAGAVHAPLLDRVYFAGRGQGAWLQDATGLHRLTGPSGEHSVRLLGTGFAYEAEIRREQYAQFPGLMDGYTDSRALGSAALAICAVADGALDAYVESDLGEYDWAGASVIAEEAGLHVRRPTPEDSLLAVLPRESV